MDEQTEKIFNQIGFRSIRRMDYPPSLKFQDILIEPNYIAFVYEAYMSDSMNKRLLLDFLRKTNKYYIIFVSGREIYIAEFQYPIVETRPAHKELGLPRYFRYSSPVKEFFTFELSEGYGEVYEKTVQAYTNVRTRPELEIKEIKLTGTRLIVKSKKKELPEARYPFHCEVDYDEESVTPLFLEYELEEGDTPEKAISYFPLKKKVVSCLTKISGAFRIRFFLRDKVTPYFKFVSSINTHLDEPMLPNLPLKDYKCYELCELITETNAFFALKLIASKAIKLPEISNRYKKTVANLMNDLFYITKLDRML